MNKNRCYTKHFFRKIHRKLFFIENGEFLVFFKPYLLPQFLRWRLRFFEFSSSYVSLTTTENFFQGAIQFLRYLNFSIFSKKKSIIIWPVLYICKRFYCGNHILVICILFFTDMLVKKLFF